MIKCDEMRSTKLVVDFLNVADANTYKIKKKVTKFEKKLIIFLKNQKLGEKIIWKISIGSRKTKSKQKIGTTRNVEWTGFF